MKKLFLSAMIALASMKLKHLLFRKFISKNLVENSLSHTSMMYDKYI